MAKKKKMKVSEWPNKHPDLNLIEMLSYDLKHSVHAWIPANVDELNSVGSNFHTHSYSDSMENNLGFDMHSQESGIEPTNLPTSGWSALPPELKPPSKLASNPEWTTPTLECCKKEWDSYCSQGWQKQLLGSESNYSFTQGQVDLVSYFFFNK